MKVQLKTDSKVEDLTFGIHVLELLFTRLYIFGLYFRCTV